MLTSREKTLMLLTFCFAFCFALFVLIERPWNVVTNHRSNQNQSKSLFNSINDTAVGKAPINNNVINYSSVNRYEILSDSNAELSEDNEEPILTQDEVTTRQKKISTNKVVLSQNQRHQRRKGKLPHKEMLWVPTPQLTIENKAIRLKPTMTR